MTLNILIVDDEPDVREVVSEFLERKGMSVDLAFDGLHALEKIKTHEYDVIITDIKMPNMRGDRFLQEARKILPKKTKCVVMTGGVEWEDEKRALDLSDFQLRKPFEFREFLDIIERVIQERKS